MSLYSELLGVKPNCTLQEAKTAYYKQAQIYHPDKNSDSNAKEKFNNINEYSNLNLEHTIKLSKILRVGDPLQQKNSIRTHTNNPLMPMGLTNSILIHLKLMRTIKILNQMHHPGGNNSTRTLIHFTIKE